MPLLLVQTNLSVDKDARESLLAQASRRVAETLGKPERYVMVVLEDGCPMMFGGSTAPLAYLELKSIGLPEARTPALSKALCDLVTGKLGIPADRVYIEFSDARPSMWGWNGDTF